MRSAARKTLACARAGSIFRARLCARGCDEAEGLSQQTAHSSSTENSLSRERLLGPLSRQNFGVATGFGAGTG